MASRSLALVLLLAVAAAGPAAAARLFDRRQCPPEGFDVQQDFVLEQFIDGRWFVQKQVPLVYQPKRNLYCVFAEYKYLDSDNPRAGLLVNNYSNRDRVNGEVRGTSEVSGGRLTIATIPDPAQPAKLKVGLAIGGGDASTPRMIGRGGDYFILAAGQSMDPAEQSGNAYDWALISGGVPRRPAGDGCATGSRLGLLRRFSTNNAGLWLFSRKPVDPVNTQLMLEKLAELGLTATELVDVQQEGCSYEGAPGQGAQK